MLLSSMRLECWLLLDLFSDNIKVDTFESSTHSFLLRLWVTDRSRVTDQVAWRGQIIHVSSDKRQTLNDLNDITIFLMPYLAEMGVQREKCAWVKQWLRRLRLISIV